MKAKLHSLIIVIIPAPIDKNFSYLSSQYLAFYSAKSITVEPLIRIRPRRGQKITSRKDKT